MITAITPTGDRPLAFSLCQQWVKNQTVQPDQWLVIDDGKTPMTPFYPMEYVRRKPTPRDPRHTLHLNLKTAIPLIKGDKIIILEDDEYYAPRYIEEMSRRLDNHEIVGIIKAKYYHIITGGYLQVRNERHASLAQTAFKRSLLPELGRLVNTKQKYLDIEIWKQVRSRGGKLHLFDDSEKLLYVGIKGLPGRAGIGQGHNSMLYRNIKDTPGRAVLKKWIPKDYQIYLDILKKAVPKKAQASVQGIAGITVCYNTKDLMERAYNSVRKFHPDMPIIIIDGSDRNDPCATYVKSLESDKTTVLTPGRNIGHGQGMNKGINQAKTTHALIFDSDIEMLKSPVYAMFKEMEEDTYGIGFLLKTGFDGYEYGAHKQHKYEGWMPYLHAYFQLININNYKLFFPYVHHGAPCYLAMLDIYKRGLSKKILKSFPGLGHTGNGRGLQWKGAPREYIRHDKGGTTQTRIARGQPHIEGNWTMNKGLV